HSTPDRTCTARPRSCRACRSRESRRVGHIWGHSIRRRIRTRPCPRRRRGWSSRRLRRNLRSRSSARSSR
ncbi:hypothetical protein PENTCL1PPCAC_349, partial [Pristionchus entomophagus]